MGLIALILLPMSIINPLTRSREYPLRRITVRERLVQARRRGEYATHMPIVEVRAHKRTYLISLHAHFIIPALIAEYGLVFRLNCRGVQFDPFDCLFRKVCELREIKIVPSASATACPVPAGSRFRHY